MTATDPALTALAQGWCALSLLHGRIETHIERALQAGHDLSVRCLLYTSDAADEL